LLEIVGVADMDVVPLVERHGAVLDLSGSLVSTRETQLVAKGMTAITNGVSALRTEVCLGHG